MVDLWLIVVIAFGAALVIGFGIVLARARADAVSGHGDRPAAGADSSEAPQSREAIARDAMARIQRLAAQGQTIQAVEELREQSGSASSTPRTSSSAWPSRPSWVPRTYRGPARPPNRPTR